MYIICVPVSVCLCVRVCACVRACEQVRVFHRRLYMTKIFAGVCFVNNAFVIIYVDMCPYKAQYLGECKQICQQTSMVRLLWSPETVILSFFQAKMFSYFS